MTRSIVGWLIIAAVLCSVNALLLWPFFRLARRAYGKSRRLSLGFGAATVVMSFVLWYLIPIVVHQLFGRSGH